MASPCRSLCSYLILVDRWRQGSLCVIQSPPHADFGCVTRFAEWFFVRPSFLFSPLPPPPSKISFPLAPYRKAWYSGYSGGWKELQEQMGRCDGETPMPRNYQAAENSTTSQRAPESCYKFKKEVTAYSKGQSRWRNVMAPAWALDVSKVRKFWKRKRTNSDHVYAIVTATSKVKLFKSIGAVGYLNTWLPRSIFVYSNNTLLTAGCCKSELRCLKHWYRLLCPGLVKPILGHSFGRSWYMRLFHTPSTSFL